MSEYKILWFLTMLGVVWFTVATLTSCVTVRPSVPEEAQVKLAVNGFRTGCYQALTEIASNTRPPIILTQESVIEACDRAAMEYEKTLK